MLFLGPHTRDIPVDCLDEGSGWRTCWSWCQGRQLGQHSHPRPASLGKKRGAFGFVEDFICGSRKVCSYDLYHTLSWSGYTRLNNEGFINMMSRVKISLLAVDEAHCISQVRHWDILDNPTWTGAISFSGGLVSVQSISKLLVSRKNRMLSACCVLLQPQRRLFQKTSANPSSSPRKVLSALQSSVPSEFHDNISRTKH